MNWLRQRWDPERPDGRILTVGLLLAVTLTAGFESIAEDVVLQQDIARLDGSILQAMYGWRSDGLTAFFTFITNLAGVESVLVGLMALALASRGNRPLVALFSAAAALGVVVTQLLKVLFGRLRPDEAWRLVVENGFSFPSGHTFLSTMLFGLAAYVLWRNYAGRRWRWLVAGAAVLLVGLVGFSRMYLGVHYPSDVLASLLFASAFVSLFVTALELQRRFGLWSGWRLPADTAKPLAWACLSMAVVSGFMTAAHYY